MIYLIYGSDTIAKSKEIKKISEGVNLAVISSRDMSLELILSYAEQLSLFDNKIAVVLENPLSLSIVVFDKELLEILKNSKTVFIFNEDALTILELKKYKKYIKESLKFDRPEVKKVEISPFIVANAFGVKDKIGAWSSYRGVIEKGVEPEAVAGMLFWKIKTMLTTSPKPFTVAELLKASSSLIDIYHKAHNGEVDMIIGLEQFILDTL